MDESGNLIKGFRGPVPDGFAQTAVVAEHFGLMIACEEKVGEHMELSVDCAALIRGWQNVKKAKHPKNALAGYWRWYEKLPKLDDIIKVKAHLKVEDVPEGPERAAVVANGHADTQAKLAVAESNLPAEDIKRYGDAMLCW